MNSLTKTIRQRLEDRKILLMTHLIVGYPSPDVNRRMLQIMAEHDVDLIELQCPFSEPMADGPTFVHANEKALANGVTLPVYLDFFQEAVQTSSAPLLMMGYYNTAFRLGHEAFCQSIAAVGGQGFILPDLPIDEYHGLEKLAADSALSPIQLVTPTSSVERLNQIAELASGFVYAVARKGVTGARTEVAVDDGLDDFLARCRAATDLPLALGFGLREPDDLRRLHGRADIAIVGSALLNSWEQHGEAGFRELIAGLAAARYS